MDFKQNRGFLEVHSLPLEAITTVIDRAGQLAKHCADRTMPQALKGKRVGVIVNDTGWRNTVFAMMDAATMRDKRPT
ncbi:hypothetical protein ACDY97_04225 [Rhizobium mongolense]|uniref:hypothetical protein n=1 Tax=Rhizobium mongolense TaxID=57676 RepID=UPI0035578031